MHRESLCLLPWKFISVQNFEGESKHFENHFAEISTKAVHFVNTLLQIALAAFCDNLEIITSSFCVCCFGKNETQPD